MTQKLGNFPTPKKMKMSKVGAIVGRFQVPYLHEGHTHLIDEAVKRSDMLLIILGSPLVPDEKNILSSGIRQGMIWHQYPKAEIADILDHRDNKNWSEDLDHILSVYGTIKDVMLYGSRDCFIKFYTGKYPFTEISEIPGISGTDIRAHTTTINNVHYRHGLIDGFNLKTIIHGEK